MSKEELNEEVMENNVVDDETFDSVQDATVSLDDFDEVDDKELVDMVDDAVNGEFTQQVVPDDAPIYVGGDNVLETDGHVLPAFANDPVNIEEMEKSNKHHIAKYIKYASIGAGAVLATVLSAVVGYKVLKK